MAKAPTAKPKPRKRRAKRSRKKQLRRRYGVALLLFAAAALIFGGGLLMGLIWQQDSAPGAGEEARQEVPVGDDGSAVAERGAESAEVTPETAPHAAEDSAPTYAAAEPEPGSDVAGDGSGPDGASSGDLWFGDVQSPNASSPEALSPDGLSQALPPGGGARVALVIDDLGRSTADIETLARLGVPLSYAVLPFESHTPQVVAALQRRRSEILLHIPMEPAGDANPGPGALTRGMSEVEVRAAMRRALAAVQGAEGVNNHMGSGFTTDLRGMTAVLEEVRSSDLFFLDSRTSPRSVGYEQALALGIPAAERQVFLDGDADPQAIRLQFRRLLDMARQRGAAIAIGHPYPSTLEVLASEVPKAHQLGYEFVPVSYLLDRSDSGSAAAD
ncbi:MAG: divergent polysaccharide deacetylase family protein [Acidobacteriota bacterium]